MCYFAVYYVSEYKKEKTFCSIVVAQAKSDTFHAKKTVEYLLAESVPETEIDITGFQKISYEEALNWYNDDKATIEAW